MQNPSETKDSQPWTILKLLRWTTSYFKSNNVENPRASAEILLAHTLAVRRIDLYIRYDQPLGAVELARFKSLIKRRVNQEPVAYIVGMKEFWSMELEVTADVLIPRPETECLVEAALSLLPPRDSGSRPLRILELGTGSGAIVIAMASERQNDLFFASDRFISAIHIAKKNAMRHGFYDRINFFCGDWFSPLNQSNCRFDMILSNPPYIRSQLVPILQPEISRYEPIPALDGNSDGLGSLRSIIDSAHHYLSPNGTLLLEIGYDQKDNVSTMIKRSGFYKDLTFKKDYGGYDRVVQAVVNHN